MPIHRWALPVLLSLFLVVAAENVRLEEKTACQLKPMWSSTSEDLYKLASSWSKTHDVSRWDFSTTAKNCSKVQYDTRVHLPSFFVEFYSILLHVDKLVCVRERRLRETLIISNIQFVDDVVIHLDAFATEAQTSLIADYSFFVPWYLANVERIRLR
jgi:hypothetical protein